MKFIASDGKELSSIKSLQKYEEKLLNPIKVKKTIKLSQKAKLNAKYRSYQTRAKSKNIEFVFSLEEFNKLISQDCYYCGQNNANTLDRINSNLGYTFNNVVPACSYCNLIKFTYSTEYMYNHIEKMIKYRDNAIK